MELPAIYIPKEMVLPDNDQWQFRFNVQSSSSNRLYTIGQHKKKKHWGCSCPGWRRHRNCQHLRELGIPGKETPYEVNLIKQ